jgi:hypothetical protein
MQQIEANMNEQRLPPLSTLRQVNQNEISINNIIYIYYYGMFIYLVGVCIVGCYCTKQAMEERAVYSVTIGT